MPHIILEYSQELQEQTSIPAVLRALHEALASADKEANINAAGIKTRSHALQGALVGGTSDRTMAHITLSLMAGRSLEIRQKLGDSLYTALQESFGNITPLPALTLEVREITKETYHRGT